jgi:hypothetical protein
MEMDKIDIDRLLDSTSGLKTEEDEYPIIMFEIDKILENTCDW